jgi:Fe2+ transport system protein FeoA
MSVFGPMASTTCRFSDLKPGIPAQIVGYNSNSDCLQRLREMGLTVGTKVEVTKVAPLGDPIEVCFRCQKLCLRCAECDGIDVELL